MWGGMTDVTKLSLACESDHDQTGDNFVYFEYRTIQSPIRSMDPNRASADSMEAKLELWRQRKSLESTSSSSSTTSSPHSLSPVKKRALSEDSTRMSPRPKTTTTTTTITENKENHKIKKTTGPPKTSSPVTNQRMKIQKSSASPTTCTTGMDIIPQRGTQNQNHIVVQTDQTSARSRVVNSHKVRLQNPTNISSPSPTSRCPHPFENPMVVTQIIQDSIAKEMASLKDMVVQTLVEQRQSVVVDEPEQLEMVQKEMKTKRATECFKALQHLRERVEFNSHHHMYDEYIRAIEKDTSLLDDSLETKLAENSALNFEKEILSQQLEEVRKVG